MSTEDMSKENPMGEEELDFDNKIVLTDDDGNEVEFEFLDLIEYEGSEYIVLLPAEPSGEEEDAVTILKCDDAGEEDYENFVGVDSEEELEAVFAIFREHFKDVFDFADDADAE